MSWTTLIDAETLRRHQGAGWRVFDCRCSPVDPDAGRRAYRAGHIAGARFADLDRVLAGPPTARSGRHPLPEPEALAAWFANEGVGADTQIVAYDDAGGAFAARLWWLARRLGHSAAAVLDGGLRAWREAEGALETGDTAPPEPAVFPRRAPLARALDAGDVLEIVRGGRLGRLVDARSSPRYRGSAEPIDPVAGHIPGAVNRPFAENLDARGRFLGRETLRKRFEAVGASPDELVHYCGSGVTACHNLLAMEHAGLAGSSLYPGSWSEWIRDPSRPRAVDDAEA